MKKEIIVSLNNVSFSYNSVPIVKDITFSIEQNDFLGIIGPNGGGKTTLLKILLGLIKPQKGTVKVFNKLPEQGRDLIGYIPQQFNFNLDFPINVLEIVLMGRLGKRGLYKKYSEEDIKISFEALKTVGMEKLKDRQIGELSGGQRQRVFLARALATQPKLLLLDEPMSSIDPKWQNSFYELLAKLKKKMAIVLVTHDISAVSVYVDKIACLNCELYYHGSTEKGIKHLENTYKCPIELIAHGVPHRVLERHKND